MAAVTVHSDFGAQENKSVAVPIVFLSICREVMGLDGSQAGFKITGRNINNLRYANDATLMAESEEELKSLLMKIKRRVKKLA